MGHGSRFRKRLDQLVKKSVALVKGLDAHALIAAVESNVIPIKENSLDSIGGNPGDAQSLPVCRTHHHDGYDRDTRPEGFCSVADGCQDVWSERRGGPRSRLAENFYADFVVRNDLLQGGVHELDGILGEDAAVHGSGRELWQCVHGVPAFQEGGHTGGAESGVPGRRSRGQPLHGFLKTFTSVREVFFSGASFDFCHFLEVRSGYFVGLERKSEIGKPLQRSRQAINGVVSDGHGAVAAFVAHLESKIDDVFLTDLQIVGNFLALGFLAPSAFVESKLGIDKFAVILEEPAHAIVWSATLFVRGESHNDVAVGRKALLLVLNQVGDPDRGLSFIVAGAAAIKETIPLEELKGVHAPVLAFGFDDINVREKENRFEGSRPVIANDEIGFLWTRAAHEDIKFRKASCTQANCGSLGNGSSGARGETGLDFDKFFVDVVRQLSLRLRPRGLGTDENGAEEQYECQLERVRFFPCGHAGILPRGSGFTQPVRRRPS